MSPPSNRLYLVRVWPEAGRMRASVRSVGSEAAPRMFSEPASLAEHLWRSDTPSEAFDDDANGGTDHDCRHDSNPHR
jgi:hypothetical protein